MADNNNNMAGKMPKRPNPALKKLERLVGSWRQSGEYNGTAAYEWMEGKFFFIQRYDGITPYGRRVKGIEYIGFDEETQTLRSHLIGNGGENFTYTWDITGKLWTIWFGDKGSKNFYQGKFSKDGSTAIGRWQWPEGNGQTGGFTFTSTRIN